MVIGGDVVLKVLGILASQPADLPRIRVALNNVEPGQEISVTVLRSAQVTDLNQR